MDASGGGTLQDRYIAFLCKQLKCFAAKMHRVSVTAECSFDDLMGLILLEEKTVQGGVTRKKCD